MTENEKHLHEILHVLDKEDLLSGVILIGSWSLLFYREIFLNYEPSIRTTDLDFYVPNAKNIRSNGNVISSLKNLNYDLVRDVLSNKSRFISPDGFELEFLTKLSRDNLHCIKIGNTGIYAESLPYLEIFSGNYIEVDFDGMKIKVASPASYILQKLLINGERKDKAEKDIASIKEVLIFVKASKKSSMELKDLYELLPKSWKRKIEKVLTKNNINLFD